MTWLACYDYKGSHCSPFKLGGGGSGGCGAGLDKAPARSQSLLCEVIVVAGLCGRMRMHAYGWSGVSGHVETTRKDMDRV